MGHSSSTDGLLFGEGEVFSREWTQEANKHRTYPVLEEATAARADVDEGLEY